MNETPAVTVTDSAPVALPELSSLTQEQRQTWRTTGKLPSEKQDSAPAKTSEEPEKSETAVADSAPQKEAVSASDSATDKTQPHVKPKDYGEKRYQELANENKSLRDRLEALERRSSQTEKREVKQDSQPAPVKDEYKPLDEKEWFTANAGKTYEDFVRAAARHEAQWEAKNQIELAIQNERQRISQESAARELESKVSDANERYGKEEAAKIFPALNEVVTDQKVPMAVKAMLNDSDVLVDLMYTLASDPAEFSKFLNLAKSNPAAAIRQIVTTEGLVRETLKGNSSKATPERGKDGKFQAKEPEAKPEAAEPVTRAPRPPEEVGGRSTSPTDEVTAAVKSGDFRSVKAAMTRDYAASHKF
jgi:hypothetical protein